MDGTIRHHEALEASASRRLAVGALSVLVGGALLICALSGLGHELPGLGRLSGPVGVALALTFGALGAWSFAQGTVERERAHAGFDPLVALVAAAVVLPLAALGAGGYRYANPPDKHFDDPALPYRFDYPGSWHRMRSGLPPTTLESWAGIARENSGVSVGTFVPAARPRLEAAFKADVPKHGREIMAERELLVDGLEAFQLDISRGPGTHEIRQTVVLAGRVAYLIDCEWQDDPDAGREGCGKVLATFDAD